MQALAWRHDWSARQVPEATLSAQQDAKLSGPRLEQELPTIIPPPPPPMLSVRSSSGESSALSRAEMAFSPSCSSSL